MPIVSSKGILVTNEVTSNIASFSTHLRRNPEERRKLIYLRRLAGIGKFKLFAKADFGRKFGIDSTPGLKYF